MSYLVLARKWRPRDFESLVGQDHVVRALTHALTTQRLHHAWLFTGTRGVGKTTLSRILAKSLNCETGITAKPCGVCRACTEIDSGRFVDYVELDAASNRGVEEMTQLLEQAIYAPSVGRFKVYMIDEVHMLSGHAFNAMLKTLEEPPPHVKFIIATTDPQKIPPTVLSRCLQFNLKQMPPEAVAEYLNKVLTEEQVPFEEPALRLIGRAASGSMRDALSLTDQAIAYSSANLTLDAVRTMLGSVDQTHLTRLLQALVSGDAPGVKAVADTLAMRGISFRAALSDFSVLLSQLAIEQHVPGDPDAADALDPEQIALARQMAPDLLQLFYTISVHGRQELAIAPDEYAGFMMVCLKMLSFVDKRETNLQQSDLAGAEKKTLAPTQIVNTAANLVPAPESDKGTASTPSPEQSTVTDPSGGQGMPVERLTPHPLASPRPASSMEQAEPVVRSVPDSVEQVSVVDMPSPVPLEIVADGSPAVVLDERFRADWPTYAAALPLSGMAQQLATQSACVAAADDSLTLQVPTQALTKGSHVERLKQVLTQQLQRPVKLTVTVGGVADGSSAQSIADAQARERQRQAEEIVRNDPFVNELIKDFGGEVIPGTIKPVTSP